MTLSRRSLLATGALLLAAPAALAVPDHNLAFRIMRKGSRIGTHAVTFARTGDALSVTIDIDMAVGFGPITLFRYGHHGVERWAGDSFDGLDTKTNYDGEPGWCTIRRDSTGLVVEGAKVARYRAAANALPATHWNRAETTSPMINPESGAQLHTTVVDEGNESVALATGNLVPATRYAWHGEDKLELWYDRQSVWTALRAVTSGGDVLTYEKL